MSVPEVVIIGAGLAGLACALDLENQGIPVLVVEAADRPGGRIKTDRFEGFQLDHGFQVFLSAYPEAVARLDYMDLDLQSFYTGALTRAPDGFRRITDPFQRPLEAMADLSRPVTSPADLFRLARLRNRVTSGTLEELFRRPEQTSLQYLQGFGFSPQLVERFFRPFFGGVFLEAALSTSSRMFEFVFRMMASGEVGVPAGGMEEIPRQLVSRLQPGSIRVGTEAVELSERFVTLEDGESIRCRAVVVATDGTAAARLLGWEESQKWCGACCLYFAAESPPYPEPVLALGGEASGPINNLAVMTNVSPTYGPSGSALISVTVLDTFHRFSDRQLTESVLLQARRWFGERVAGWRLLKVYRIPRALPAQPPGILEPPQRGVRLRRGLYVCGDHRDSGSINGALASGRRAAVAAMEDLG
jgi:phytoene dehydrogenase-like protein